MRIYKHIMIAIGMAGVAGVPTNVESQTLIKSSQPVSRIARAVELQEKAVALHDEPRRAADAAWLHKKSAALRSENDPEAVHSLITAAHLYNYAKRPFDARKTMEQAAERALAMGDVARAAQAYVDATFLAAKENNRFAMRRLGRKALSLAESPLLDSEQRSAIVKRIKTNPSLASVAGQ